jgi:uncharacterized protein (TIGR02285 family)
MYTFFFFIFEVYANDSLKIMYFDRPPYVEKQGQNYITGLLGSKVMKIIKNLDINVELLEIPPKRQLLYIADNEDMYCGVGWFKTKEREKIAKFTSYLYKDTPFIALAKSDNPKIGKIRFIKDLLNNKKLIFLTKNSFSYGEYIDNLIKKYKPIKSVVSTSTQNMFKMLNAGRADYIFLSYEEAVELIVKNELSFTDFIFINFQDVPTGNKRYLMCSRKVSDQVIAKINRIIAKINK